MIKVGIRVHLDDRPNYTAGWKYNHYELKGVPIRLEIGPDEVKENLALVAVRASGEKSKLSLENIGAALQKKLDEIHDYMLNQAKNKLAEK